MEEKLCEYCGKSFKAYKKAERRFCGKECWYSSIRGKKVGNYSKERVDAIVAAKKYYYFKRLKNEEVILKRKDPRLFYRIDFVLGNKIAVEVRGDYWHGNPEVFKEEELNETQLNNKKRDIDKMKLIKKEYPEVMVIWEGDLKKNLKKQKGKIYEKYYNKSYV